MECRAYYQGASGMKCPGKPFLTTGLMMQSQRQWTAGLLIFLSLGAVPQFLNAQTYYTEKGQVEFESEVPLHSFKGTSGYLIGKISMPDSTVDFYLDLRTLDTGNNKRDKDMRETLEADQYPFAEFYGKIITPIDSTVQHSQRVKVKGDFTIHGVSKEIIVEGTLQQTDEGLRIKAAWILKLTDYNIEPPGILFYRVSEEVDVQINALLKPM